MLVSSKYLINKAYHEHFAIGAFNIGETIFAKNVVAVAEELNAPVILQIYPLEYELMTSDAISYILRLAMKATVPVAVHLDHGRGMDDVTRAIRDQMNSVMIDASGMEFDANMNTTKAVVDMAHRVGVAVEAELGSIGDRHQTDATNMGRVYTEPASAKKFVDHTGVDFLAVSIGTVHGPYPSGANEIRIDILQELNATLQLPLVLHGGSNNPDAKIKEAIQNGIAKVNISTDIKMPYYHAIHDAVEQMPNDYEPWIITKQADKAQRQVIAEKIKLFGSDGKAPLYFTNNNELTETFH
ncbi:class II fructose-bisphosphate aldolase [Ligilactobacillus saerimneri]|uniref:class II fructose-bisphosphate aldolase n=1 Tax=Ligilactobacillus saerimneri TaxID=228229 RepID=UPI0024B1BDA9|nr:ketose-bisphosphate aldolase [Ligilactobacillus saerimneri]MDI9206159.1 ketose-bisphosphate aldolase [Ligilactobacillus saerimneri]